MSYQFRFFLLALSILAVSCTKEVKYSKEDLLKLAQKADPSVTVILPNSLTEGISCTDYPEGCVSAHIVRVQKLDLIAVEFQTEAEAIFAAKKVRGYYLRNWLLDDVRGEPVLEEFAVEKLKAKKP